MFLETKIIARFPPSPTGWFHIGNVRTALFNYFFVKQNNGKLLFRLEDTDIARSKEEYALDIVEGLKWLNIDMDYSNIYKQSEHGETYKKYIEKLLTEGKAYISKEEVVEEGQREEVIRFKNPNKVITFTDMIRGEVSVDTTELGDFVIAKSVYETIYHFAVVVDDFEMGVNYIIRGEDGIYNTPRQILIQEALGITRPIYAHMPFILNSDRSKLSKRKQGELVSLKYYRELGYLPEAMINYLAFCGWNPGGEREIYSLDEIIKLFDIHKVQKAGAVFNIEKLNWFNKEYIKMQSEEDQLLYIKQYLPNLEKYSDQLLKKLRPVLIDRISYYGELKSMHEAGELDYYTSAPVYRDPSEIVWKKSNKENTIQNLESLKDLLENKSDIEEVWTKIYALAEEKGKGDVLWPLRYSLSGKEKSPDPKTLIHILGVKESLLRIENALKLL